MHRTFRIAALAVGLSTALAMVGCAAGAPAAVPSDPGALDLSSAVISEEAAATAAELYEAALEAGEDTVTIYTISAEDFQPVFDLFSQTFPGIAVDAHTLFGPELIGALQAESASGNYVADLMNNPNFLSYSQFTEIASYEPASYEIPDELATFSAALEDPSGLYTTPFFGIYGVGANVPALAGEEVPTDWADFADPKWKGRIGMHDASVPGPGQETATQLLLSGAVDEDTLAKIVDNAVVKGDYAQVIQGLARGEYPVMLGIPREPATRMADDGAPIEFHVMDSDNVFVLQRFALQEHAPNPNAAKLFLEFLNFLPAQDSGAFTPLRADADSEDRLTLGDVNITAIPTDAELQAARAEFAPLFSEMFRTNG